MFLGHFEGEKSTLFPEACFRELWFNEIIYGKHKALVSNTIVKFKDYPSEYSQNKLKEVTRHRHLKIFV